MYKVKYKSILEILRVDIDYLNNVDDIGIMWCWDPKNASADYNVDYHVILW